jgi:hypothetical protein
MNVNTGYYPNTAVSCARKSLLAALLLAGVVQVDIAHAAAVNNGDQLTIDSGVTGGYYGYVTGGSYFMMDSNGSGTFSAPERTAMRQGTQGLVIGVVQPAGTSHSGIVYGYPAPDNSEGGAIDAAWPFLGNTGMHFTASPITGSTTAGLNFSGWTVTWNGIPAISMGGGLQNCGTAFDGICLVGTTDIAGTINNGTGLATFSWSGVYGTGYTLDYTATVPLADPSGFGGVYYGLHLVGTVNAVPLPAAVWLFGSGLMGLIGLARRRES